MLRRVARVLDWRFLLSAAFLALVITASLNSWATVQHNRALMAQLNHDRAAAVVERSEASRERQRILDGQQDLQVRHERLLDYLRSQGIEVPESVYRTTRVDGDNDDGGDTNITVRPETSNDQSDSGSSSSPSPSPSASNSDSNVTDVVPEVPLPAPAGEATDTAKRIIEDVTGIVTE